MTLTRLRSVDREPIVYNDNEQTRVQTCDDDTSLFPAKAASPLSPVLEKRGRKKVLVMLGRWLGIIPSNRCCQFSMISEILEEIHL